MLMIMMTMMTARSKRKVKDTAANMLEMFNESIGDGKRITYLGTNAHEGKKI